jgi:hypothetical protein
MKSLATGALSQAFSSNTPSIFGAFWTKMAFTCFLKFCPYEKIINCNKMIEAK